VRISAFRKKGESGGSEMSQVCVMEPMRSRRVTGVVPNSLQSPLEANPTKRRGPAGVSCLDDAMARRAR
jgi:hypothetical protein